MNLDVYAEGLLLGFLELRRDVDVLARSHLQSATLLMVLLLLDLLPIDGEATTTSTTTSTGLAVRSDILGAVGIDSLVVHRRGVGGSMCVRRALHTHDIANASRANGTVALARRYVRGRQDALQRRTRVCHSRGWCHGVVCRRVWCCCAAWCQRRIGMVCIRRARYRHRSDWRLDVGRIHARMRRARDGLRPVLGGVPPTLMVRRGGVHVTGVVITGVRDVRVCNRRRGVECSGIEQASTPVVQWRWAALRF